MTQILKHTPPATYTKEQLEPLLGECLTKNYPRKALTGYFSCNGGFCALTHEPKHIAVTFWDNNSDTNRSPEQMHIICTNNTSDPFNAVTEYFASTNTTRADSAIFDVVKKEDGKEVIVGKSVIEKSE